MENSSALTPSQPIGYVIGGGLEANLQVRLNVQTQNVQEGAFVVIDSNNWRFYCLVTDLLLTSINEQYANQLNSQRFAPFLAQMLNNQTLFTNLAVMPVLMKDKGPELDSPDYADWRRENTEDPSPMPVKTIPNHHAPVKLADQADIADIFGEENNKEIFHISAR